MAHEPILILDPDASSRKQLTEILTAGGYDVYGVKAADRLVEAVKASPFPAVMIDLWIPNIDRGALIQAIHEASPYTAAIMMGEKQIFPWLLEVFREGAADFVLKPFDPIEVRQRVDAVLAGRQQRLEALTAPKTGPHRLPPPVSPDEMQDMLKSFRDFQDQSLEIFLDLERKNLELERQIAALRDPTGSAELTRDVLILVAHPDAALSQGLTQAVTTFGSRLEPQAYTGGECLDRLGQSRADVVLVGSELPDIPGTIVASSVKSQYPEVEVLLLEVLASGELQVQVLGDGDADASAHPYAVHSQQDLLNLLKDRCRHCHDRLEARRFAHEFKGRHQEYIRSLASLKSRVEKALELLGTHS